MFTTQTAATVRTIESKYIGRYNVTDIRIVQAEDALPTRFAAWVDESIQLNGHRVFVGKIKTTHGTLFVHSVSDSNGQIGPDTVWYR